ncbi:MFS transporter [Macrococcoides bohemicum]|uniref:MFS transporter n=1 Tax=Macrococcoides bohemicum TaxID=1903056 RepID=UPI001FD0257A|nr:MFS transporter [Macrococcus bohemicus]
MKGIFRLPLTIQIRLWGSFLNRITSSSIMPFIALYLTERTSKEFAGTYLLLTVIIIFLSNIISGYFCDKFGRKKILNVFSTFESICLFTIFLSVSINSTSLFIIMYMLYILVSTFKRPALTALIQDAVTKENKKLVYRLDYWLTNLSLAIGASLGGFLYKDYKEGLFLSLTITSFILTILYILFIKENKRLKNNNHKNPIMDFYISYREVITDKRYVSLVIGGALILSAELCTSSYISVRLAEDFKDINMLGIDITGIKMFSLINIINTTMVILFTFIVGFCVDRFSFKKIFIIGLIAYICGYTALMSANSFYMLVFSIIIATLGELVYSPIKSTEQLDLVPKEKRGVYASFSSVGYTLSDSIAKITLILSSFLSPIFISIFIFFIVSIGSILLYLSIFYKRKIVNT